MQALNWFLNLLKNALHMLHLTNFNEVSDSGSCSLRSPLTQTTTPHLLTKFSKNY